jgi:transcriptional regulator with XRE-family HTH domain
LEIGARLRRIRTQRGLVIDDLVQQTGLSRPYISQVETGKAVPSLPALQRLAAALKVPLAYLFIEEAVTAAVSRKDQHPLMTFGEEGTESWRRLWFLSAPDRQIEMVILEIPVGYTAGGRNHLHDGEECHYILSGRIRAIQGERVYTLEEGDSYHWDGSVPHRVENAGRKPARILIARTPPGFLSLKIYADAPKEQDERKSRGKRKSTVSEAI